MTNTEVTSMKGTVREIMYILKNVIFKTHPVLCTASLVSSVLSMSLQTLYIPNLTVDLFTELQNEKVLKKRMKKLVFIWILNQVIFGVSEKISVHVDANVYHNLNTYFIKGLFHKYSAEHKELSPAVILLKLNIIRNNLDSLITRIFNTVSPRIISIFLVGIKLYRIYPPLGTVSILITIIQILIITKLSYHDGKSGCIFDKIKGLMKEHEELIQNLEDKFTNIEIINSVWGGIIREVRAYIRSSRRLKKITINVESNILYHQYILYCTNIVLFSTLLGILYHAYKNKKITSRDVMSSLVTINGLFDNIYEIAYYIPELIRKWTSLKAYAPFLKEIRMINESTKTLSEIEGQRKNAMLQDLPPNGAVVIKFKNVSFSYPRSESSSPLPVLRNVSFAINRGDYIILTGIAGCGKSTIMKLIRGALLPDGGEILYHPRFLPPFIAYIQQNTNKVFNTTIGENIMYGLRSSPESLSLMESLFARCQNTIFENKQLTDVVLKGGSNLSGGQCQMIHLIRGYINTYATVILLDEPTRGLDPGSVQLVLQFIRELHGMGKTILIISHDSNLTELERESYGGGHTIKVWKFPQFFETSP